MPVTDTYPGADAYPYPDHDTAANAITTALPRADVLAAARVLADTCVKLDANAIAHVITGALSESYAQGHADGSARGRAIANARINRDAAANDRAYAYAHAEGYADGQRAVAHALGWEYPGPTR
jgi:hypothetical protein